MDKKSAYPKVKYYFDISDTQESRNAYLYPPVPLWEVEEQHYDDVKEAVINAFGVSNLLVNLIGLYLQLLKTWLRII